MFVYLEYGRQRLDPSLILKVAFDFLIEARKVTVTSPAKSGYFTVFANPR